MALAAAGLALILPAGTSRYIALGTSADLVAGTFTELAVPGYARKSHASWTTEVVGGVVRRKNNIAVVFAALTSGASGVAWWAIFDAAVGGNMLAAGPVLNIGGVPQPATFAAGDQPRFNVGDLRLTATPEEV